LNDLSNDLPLPKKLKMYGSIIIIIFLLAAYLRFDFLVSVNHHNSHDTVNYDIMVRQLLEEGVYGYKSVESNAKVPPGFPLFMAAVYKLVDYEHNNALAAIRYLQGCFSLITLWLIYRITQRLGGRTPALLAAAIAAIYPPFIWANGAVLTEVLANLLFMSFIYLQLIAFERTSRWSSLFAGAALALTVLTRSEFLILLPVSYGMYFLWSRKPAQTLRLLLYGCMGFAIILTPWVIRNVITLHEPVIASTQVNPFAAGTYPHKNYDDGLVDRHGKTQMEVAKERLQVGFTTRTWEFTKWYTVGKLKYIYGKMFYGSGHRPAYPVIPYKSYLHLALVILSVIASAHFLRSWRKPASLIVVLLLATSFMRLAFVPEYRYNFTAMPSIIVIDCLFITYLIKRMLQSSKLRSLLSPTRRSQS
jgi:4-amino-4-deoxy-L-arabinose transferase-like glycosyltransferase